jgi:hypothetical protein
MNVRYIFLLLFVSIVGYSFIKIKMKSPEDLLVGDWSEQTWKYERVATPSHKKYACKDSLSTSLKEHLGKGLFLHENETWSFLPNGELHITAPDKRIKILHWRLKGKGDMLVIKDENKKPMEHYKVTHINKDSLSLSFELDIQVKGLASLTFRKSV